MIITVDWQRRRGRGRAPKGSLLEWSRCGGRLGVTRSYSRGFGWHKTGVGDVGWRSIGSDHNRCRILWLWLLRNWSLVLVSTISITTLKHWNTYKRSNSVDAIDGTAHAGQHDIAEADRLSENGEIEDQIITLANVGALSRCAEGCHALVQIVRLGKVGQRLTERASVQTVGHDP